ncbi:MAG: hypothetical protein RR346_01295 [Bacteroidales bacterium]
MKQHLWNRHNSLKIDSVDVNLGKGIAYVAGTVKDEKVIGVINQLGYKYVE